MIAHVSVLLALSALSHAGAVLPRTVAALDQPGFQVAQQRDDTATRAFSSVPIKTSDGQCLFVDELSGDSRANLTPIQVAACDGSKGQQWDIITKGKHDNQAGQMLVVNTLTNACMNFDPRRAAGNTVIMFSCGGRADGSGDFTTAQLFAFNGGSGPLSFAPENTPGTCLAVTGKVLDSASCSSGAATQSFTFGGAAGGNAKASSVAATTTAATSAAEETTTEAAASTSAPQTIADPVVESSACAPTAFVTVTRDSPAGATSTVAATTEAASSETATTTEALATSAAPVTVANGAIAAKDPAIENPTTPVPVSRAGVTLQPSSAAESQKRDDSATRAFSSVQLQSGNGLCLFVDPTAGDFRQNLIPVQHAVCNSASPDQKFDLITKGAHNDAANSMLVVSSVMQGCLSFDERRAAGDTVQMFSCGGRGDGSGQVTNSQLYTFNGTTSFTLAPENTPGTCLGPDNAFGGKLNNANCDGSAAQTYSVVQ